MHFELSGPYKAGELFSLQQTELVPGLPDFANLKAERLPHLKGTPETFKGPGLYGVFCRGTLYYVGIYTGDNKQTFAGSVLKRWYMHLTYHGVRSPQVTFAKRELQKILSTVYGEPADSIARLLGGRDADIARITSDDSPLVQRNGGSCTANKVRFAQRNWNVFAPGNEEAMANEVSFVYARFLPSITHLLGSDHKSGQAYSWAKYQWLQQRETRLVKTLMPICNAVTLDCREDVSVDEFVTALRQEMSSPPPAMPSGRIAA